MHRFRIISWFICKLLIIPYDLGLYMQVLAWQADFIILLVLWVVSVRQTVDSYGSDQAREAVRATLVS